MTSAKKDGSSTDQRLRSELDTVIANLRFVTESVDAENPNNLVFIDHLLEQQFLKMRSSLEEPLIVGVVGIQGQGKSRAINELVGTHVLPTAEGESGTDCIITIENHSYDYYKSDQRSDKDKKYHAIVHFVDESAWESEVTFAREILFSDPEESDEKALNVVRQKLQRLAGVDVEEADALLTNPAKGALHFIAEEVLEAFQKGFHEIHNNDLKLFRNELTMYACCDKYVPLIEKIEIKCPLPAHFVNVKFMDIPGLGTNDDMLVQRFTEGTRLCDVLLYVKRKTRSKTMSKQLDEFLFALERPSHLYCVITHACSRNPQGEDDMDSGRQESVQDLISLHEKELKHFIYGKRKLIGRPFRERLEAMGSHIYPIECAQACADDEAKKSFQKLCNDLRALSSEAVKLQEIEVRFKCELERCKHELSSGFLSNMNVDKLKTWQLGVAESIEALSRKKTLNTISERLMYTGSDGPAKCIPTFFKKMHWNTFYSKG